MILRCAGSSAGDRFRADLYKRGSLHNSITNSCKFENHVRLFVVHLAPHRQELCRTAMAVEVLLSLLETLKHPLVQAIQVSVQSFVILRTLCLLEPVVLAFAVNYHSSSAA